MLDYQIQDKDTGINDIDSVQPWSNAEDADQTVLRRTPENLRTRSEVIRKAIDELSAVVGLDRAMTIIATPDTTIAWGGASDVDLGLGNGTGIPTLNAPVGVGTGALQRIAVQSMLSNAKLLDASGNWVIGDTAIVPVLARTDAGETLTFTSEKRPWENGNNIFIRMYDSGAAQVPKAIATVEGALDGSGNPSGPVTIVISLSNGGGGIDATHADVIGAITGVAATLVTPTSSLTTATAFEITDSIDSNKGVPLEGGVDSESFGVLQSVWNVFFTGDDLLREGDSLVFTFPDAEARRKQGGSPESTLRIIRNSENVDNSNVVPICKVIQDSLIFLNGTTLVRGETLRLLPDQHLRDDLTEDTGVTAGDRLIGADAKSGTPTALVQGTVYSQMVASLAAINSLNDEYDAHVLGTADNHSIEDIDNRVYAIVGSSNADYATLAAAVEALRTTGGTIFVRPETLTDQRIDFDVDLTGNIEKQIRVIGDGRAVLASRSDSPLLKTGTSNKLNAPFVFQSIRLQQAAIASPLIDFQQAEVAEENYGIDFVQCVLEATVAPGVTAMVKQQDNNVRFHRCFFKGFNYDTGTFFELTASADGNSYLSVTECEFADGARIAVFPATGGKAFGDFIFDKNLIVNCGYSISGGAGDYGYLFEDTGVVSIDNRFKITNNTYKETSVATNRCALFCQMRGTGVITGNTLDAYMHHDISDGAGHVISAFGFEGASPLAKSVVIENNAVRVGGATWGIYGTYCQIHSNNIHDFDNITHVDGGQGIYASESSIIGNRIYEDASEALLNFTGIEAGGSCRVADNRVVFASDGNSAAYGILCSTADKDTVTGNEIVGPATGTTYGIVSEVNGTTICGNRVEGVPIGIQCSGLRNAISGNHAYDIETEGIHLTNGADYSTVSGNTIRLATGATEGINNAGATHAAISGNDIRGDVVSIGIVTTGTYTSVTGNNISNVKKGIDCHATTHCNCTGNHVSCADSASDARGIDAHGTSATDKWHTIIGNSVYCACSGTGTHYGIDVSQTDNLAVGSNHVMPNSTWNEEIYSTGVGNQVGIGVDLASQNIESVNHYIK